MTSETRGDQPAGEARSDSAERGPPIVGVGASAGGVAALQTLVEDLPSESGIAWVVVQHMAPHRPSELSTILGRKSDIPVVEVESDTRVEGDHVYVIAPGHVMTVSQGVLRSVHEGSDLAARRTSIDAFLLSLAEDRGENCGCALLSGAGSDGTLGLKAVKEAGGLTLTQTLHTAEYDSMLLSAIRTGLVDREVDVADMPGLFTDFLVRHRSVARDAELSPAQRHRICEILRSAIGHDFGGYRSSTIDRRIRRRMQLLGMSSVEDYIKVMAEDGQEPSRLFRDLLIGVTQFFRDPDSFAALSEHALDTILADKTADDEVRVWVPGCATGEEAYSLAMILLERREQMESPPEVKIFGSDIDESALHVARLGRYPQGIASDVSAERLARFFRIEGGSYVVKPQLREMCLFVQHNLLSDPPFSRIDMISCRNLLIYMTPDLQKRVMPVFHYALRPGGLLFLGPAENPGSRDKLFAEIDRTHRIFRRGSESARMPAFPIAGGNGRQTPPAQRSTGAPAADTDPAIRTAHRLLERYTPAYVIVDGDFEILESSSGTGAVLELPSGRPNANLAAMIRGELATDVKAAVAKVLSTGERLVRRDLSLWHEDEQRQFTLVVEPLRTAEQHDQRCLVIFQIGAVMPDRAARAERRQGGDAEIVRALEMELQTTRERLQSTMEELETSNEELRASNEELSSVNEELQSSNEELETSKEELQSINEELRTVNSELTARVDDLGRANSDLKNLFSNTRIAMLFLDRDNRIRSFTPPAKPLFHLRDHDVGRPLGELAGRIDFQALKEEVADVIRSGQQVEHEVEARNGAVQTLLMRMLPYRDENERIEGAVLTFVDITERKQSEERLSAMVSELNHRVKNNLASVQAMVRQAAKRTDTREELLEVLEGQLHAMSTAHDILSRREWEGACLDELAEAVLMPFTGSGSDRLKIEGPDVALRAETAVALGLVLQELATNAGKYGAWAGERGAVSLAWDHDTREDGGLRIVWSECGGPPVTPPDRLGFGLQFVERSATHELRGDCAYEFPAEGFRCTLEIPTGARLVQVGASDPQRARAVRSGGARARRAPPRGRRGASASTEAAGP